MIGDENVAIDHSVLPRAGETESGARLREIIPGRPRARTSMPARRLSLSRTSETTDDGTLERMLPAAHAAMSHAWAGPAVVFRAVSTISTAFEMAHHVLAVIFTRNPGNPGSKLRFNEPRRRWSRDADAYR